MERPKKEEFVNGLTHAAGTLLSLVAGLWLVRSVLPPNFETTKTIACLIYTASLVGVYFWSTMSHWEKDTDRKILYRRLDQAFIYILIVASFTTFSVAYLKEAYFWVLLGAMWLIAIGGFVSKLWSAHRVQSVAIWIYLALGWMTVLAVIPWMLGIELDSTIPSGCVWMILLGGLFYSGGTIFLYQDGKVWYFHAIWHVCVILGSAAHYWAILEYVA